MQYMFVWISVTVSMTNEVNVNLSYIISFYIVSLVSPELLYDVKNESVINTISKALCMHTTFLGP
jgi:hypothetical protein